MATFEIVCYDSQYQQYVKMYYDNLKQTLVFPNGNPVFVYNGPDYFHLYAPKNALRVMMGTKCNFKCSYCSQQYNSQSIDGTLKDVDYFIEYFDQHFPNQSFDEIELWGGEPLVYIKHLYKLIPFLRERYPDTRITIITNGVLLNDVNVEFFVKHQINVVLSHDGVGQACRGEDILSDPHKVELIKYMFDQFVQQQMIIKGMVNVVINDINITRLFESVDLIKGCLGDVFVSCNPMLSLNGKGILSPEQNRQFVDYCLNNIDKLHDAFDWRINRFKMHLLKHKQSVDYPFCCVSTKNAIVIDLHFNRSACHNYTKYKGELKLVPIQKKCYDCIALNVCRGACPLASGSDFQHTCANKVAFGTVIFAATVYDIVRMPVVNIQRC